MHDASILERIRRKFQALAPVMDERIRRHWAASEALDLAYGGVSQVARATGLSRTTIALGVCELRDQQASGTTPSPRIRRPGGGRRHLVDVDAGLWDALDALVDPVTRGDPRIALALDV